MKDLPHHIKKLNRRVIRSEMREEHAEELPPLPERPLSERQKKKQTKERVKQLHKNHVPLHDSEEQRNQKMKHRVPIFDRLSTNKPKATRSTHKKTPKI